MTGYANPEILVSTAWVAAHSNDAGLRVLAVDVDASAYAEGHIPTAVRMQNHLCEQMQRAMLTKEQFEMLCNSSGITNDTTVIFYSNNHNLLATYALWQFRYYGHDESRLKIMNGGRQKWLDESRGLVTDTFKYANTGYRVQSSDSTVRIKQTELLTKVERNAINLVDARSPAEFSGLASLGMTELRRGHIPNAINVPWTMTVNDDGTFKSYPELQTIYSHTRIVRDKETIVYCHTGKRSAHAWFVLKYLLGYEIVRNYDGSWLEWSSRENAPIACG